MFNNIDELRELIRQGKTNEEIIANRLLFLESNNTSKIDPIFNEGQVVFYSGFINESTLITPDAGIIDETYYTADLIDLYNEVLDIIRKKIDEKGLPLSNIIVAVWKYFTKSENLAYKELIEVIQAFFPNDKYIVRECLPNILHFYACSNYEGSITEFGKAYMYWNYGREKLKEAHKEEIEKMHSSVDWDRIDHEPIVCKLSTLKGLGVAACTESSMALQNCLTFLGYECYILAGTLRKRGITEEHNFNVLKSKSGIYYIVDSAQCSMIRLDNVNSPEDLLSLDDVTGKDGWKEEIVYNTLNYSKNKKRPLPQITY